MQLSDTVKLAHTVSALRCHTVSVHHGAMTTRTVAIRLDDESPLYQALRRYAYNRGTMKLSQAAIEILTQTLMPKEEKEETDEG